MSEDPERAKHTLSGDSEPTQPTPKVMFFRQFALGLFRDDADGHLFFGMLPVVNGEIMQVKPYRFTKSNEDTLEVFEKFKELIEGGKKRPVYLG